tara:strand:- start:340 stop:2052 length:1713 start_codon:yes stop_codon:yes gene_type:complete
MIGAFEAILFGMLGDITNWLASSSTSSFFYEKKFEVIILVIFLLSGIPLVIIADILKYQTIYGNFPMLMRWNFHRLMLSQSMSFFNDEFSGRISTKVMQTALAIRSVYITIGDIFVFIFIYFLTMVLIIGSYSVILLFPFLIWVACYIFAVRYFVPKISTLSKNRADAISLMSGKITDAYSNIATVKLFSHSQREAKYLKESMKECMQHVYPHNRLTSLFEIVNHALSTLLILFTGGTVLVLWTEDLASVGSVAAAFAMSFRLMGLSHWIMYEMASLFENIGTVRDGIRILSQRLSVQDKKDAAPLVVSSGEIIFENISFSYGSDKNVIKKLNLKINHGERVGLVGPSGGGKTTTMNLLLRFFDLTRGRILINGIDIAGVKQNSLRKNIAMVTQDAALLHRSVRDNIKYGNPTASEEEMLKAANMAEVTGFIGNLKDSAGRRGFDAHVGERGVKLSGGQRQRIAIARVILKDAPILLLDEATSALDSEVEAVIQKSLKTVMKGKTVLAIAHRLSTISELDRLIVLNDGKIVEEGTHQGLLLERGLYSRLWNLQSGGFLPTEIPKEISTRR